MDNTRVPLPDRQAYALFRRWYELFVPADEAHLVGPFEYFYAGLTSSERNCWVELAELAHTGRQRPGEDLRDVGVRLNDEGMIPAEHRQGHCCQCGEDIEVSLAHGGPAQPGSVQEYIHAETRQAHCALGFQRVPDGTWIAVSLAEETAELCTALGCKSNREHEAAETEKARMRRQDAADVMKDEDFCGREPRAEQG